MIHSELSSYTHEQLSAFTHFELATVMCQMIVNRTAQDVERWRLLRDKGWSGMTEAERREWLGESTPTPAAWKGMYTHNDLNRVESTVETILFCLKHAGYKPPNLTIKTDWTYTDTIRDVDMDRYFGNIETIRNLLKVFPTTPKSPTLTDKFNYEKANDIEKILLDVHSLVTNMTSSWRYAGEIYSGEV